MKLHTHSCHDVPCLLPLTVADLDLFFMLGLTMFNVCHLTPFFEHQCSYASVLVLATTIIRHVTYMYFHTV